MLIDKLEITASTKNTLVTIGDVDKVTFEYKRLENLPPNALTVKITAPKTGVIEYEGGASVICDPLVCSTIWYHIQDELRGNMNAVYIFDADNKNLFVRGDVFANILDEENVRFTVEQPMTDACIYVEDIGVWERIVLVIDEDGTPHVDPVTVCKTCPLFMTAAEVEDFPNQPTVYAKWNYVTEQWEDKRSCKEIAGQIIVMASDKFIGTMSRANEEICTTSPIDQYLYNEFVKTELISYGYMDDDKRAEIFGELKNGGHWIFPHCSRLAKQCGTTLELFMKSDLVQKLNTNPEKGFGEFMAVYRQVIEAIDDKATLAGLHEKFFAEHPYPQAIIQM